LALIIANVVVYVVGWIGGAGVVLQMIKWCGLTPNDVKQGYVWQLLTYMFLHANFLHLLFNMFTLWMFGCEIERSWGSKEFLKYYIITGVGAGILSFALSLSLRSNVDIPTIGASGAIFGVLVAYALMFPNRIIYLWFILPIKAKYLVGCFAILTFIASFQQPQGGGVAHFAHLGGMLIGFLYLKADWRISRIFRFLNEKTRKRKLEKLSNSRQEEDKILEQVDRILDKINAQGMDSLSGKERKILEKASYLLSKR
jgi:membrane associated rhomboid family serine protease